MQKMRAEKKRKLNIVMCIIAVIVLVSAVFLRPVITRALFDESTAVSVDPSGIENSTLIIGTHLIYLYALNDQLYAIAQDSASESGQSHIYYKSELADGTWFDITDAGSISDITNAGQVVSNDTIRGLSLTHHTKSDGITYDLRTNQAVCVFDIYNVYDLENMPELEAVKLQYDSMKDVEDKSDTDKRNIRLINEFFSTEVQTGQATDYDVELAAVQKYYEELVTNDVDAAETEAVINVMAKLDNARREIVYLIVESALDDLMDKVADGNSDSKDIDYYEIDDTLLTAIGSSQSELSESLIEAQSNKMEEGSTTLSAKEYALDNALVNDALGSNFSSCDNSVAQLISLSNISNELIVSKSAELTLLEDILQKAQRKYSEALAAGTSEEYQAAVAANSSHGVLDNIKKADAATVNSARSELEFLVKAKSDRLENDEAQSYIKNEISQTSAFLEAIPSDDYKTAMEESVESYRTWLVEQLANAKSSSSTANSSLYEEKEALMEERMEALDAENLDLAKLLEAKIDTLDAQIAATENAASDEIKALEEQLSAVSGQLEADAENTFLLAQKASLEAEIADLTTDLPSESAAANIQDTKNTILSALKEGDVDSSTLTTIEMGVDSLGGMLTSGSSLALTALKEIYQKMVALAYLNDNTSYDSLITEIEDLVAESEVLEIEENGISQDIALSVVEEVLGGTISVKQIGLEETNTGTQTEGSTGAQTDGSTGTQTEGSTGAQTDGSTGTQTDGSSGTQTDESSGTQTDGSTGAQTEGSTGAQTDGSTGTQTDGSTGAQTDGSSGTQTDGSTGAQTDGETEAVQENGKETESIVSADGLSEEELLAAMIALGEFAAETDNDDITALAEGIAANMAKSDDVCVFETHKSGDEIFVPVDLLAQFCGYRYLWNSSKKTAILSKGRKYFTFTAFYSGVENGEEQKDYMDMEAEFSGTVYIPNSYVSSQFDCEIYSISGTGYSVLANDKVMGLSGELLEALLEKGGG